MQTPFASGIRFQLYIAGSVQSATTLWLEDDGYSVQGTLCESEDAPVASFPLFKSSHTSLIRIELQKKKKFFLHSFMKTQS